MELAGNVGGYAGTCAAGGEPRSLPARREGERAFAFACAPDAIVAATVCRGQATQPQL